MSRPSILVCTVLDNDSLELLTAAADLTIRPDVTPQQLTDLLPAHTGLIVDGKTYLSASMLEQGGNLRVIGSTSPLLDRIDVTTARDYDIDVITIPDPNAVAAAEQVITLILQQNKGGTLTGKTLGLVGFGQTARQVAQRARAFGMRVIVNQPRMTPSLAREAEIELYDLVALLEQADFVSVHVPARHSQPLLTAAYLAHLSPHAILINTGSPETVDQTAVKSLLKNGRLGAVVQTAAADSIANWITVEAVAHQPAPAHRDLAKRILDVLAQRRPTETFSLDIVPIELVQPHEEHDQKRVNRLKAGLDETGTLRNPPLVTLWQGKYIVLDGATRTNALKQLGYPHIAVQIVNEGYDLHTWYHAITADQPLDSLFSRLEQFDTLTLTPLVADEWHTVFNDPLTLCYFLDKAGAATLVRVRDITRKHEALNQVVATYTTWGVVERTLITDPAHLTGLFDGLAAVAVFPQFEPDEVFTAATDLNLLPAGLTRFVVPGRILNLNVPLTLLKSDEAHAAKRAWLNRYLADKQARSRIRYYQEPIILIDP